MINISIIVCCYNSQNVIIETLKHLANQRTDHRFEYEIVLVDNNCSDETVIIARQFWDQLEINTILNIISEPTPGLSHARKKGVQSSCGDLIVFCDDDNWLHFDYLQIAYDFMQEHPEVGALGGQSIEVLESSKPYWWDKKKTSYAVGKQSNHSGEVSTRGYLWGAGLVTKKSIMIHLYEAGFESLLTGRNGNVLASGDDSEICKWILFMDYKLWYLKELKFHHFITANRLEDTYLEKLMEGHSKAHDILNLYNWFLKFLIETDGYNLTNAKKVKFFKKGIKAFINQDPKWKEYLQVVIGEKVKIHSELNHIIKTYHKIKALDSSLDYE